MNDKKGFTIIELLAVLIILGILTSVAAVGITRYRMEVKKKELINLHSTIVTGYDSYRQKQIMNGNGVLSHMSFCQDGEVIMDLSYNGDKLTCDNITDDSFIELKIKGNLLDIPSYTNKRGEMDFIKDESCLIDVTGIKEENGKKVFVKECEKNSDGSYTKSLDEIVCVYLKTDKEILIDDYDESSSSFCKYFGR